MALSEFPIMYLLVFDECLPPPGDCEYQVNRNQRVVFVHQHNPRLSTMTSTLQMCKK